jgi:aryl-alcohol dehydrogenase-like predicted oxidoreductase
MTALGRLPRREFIRLTAAAGVALSMPQQALAATSTMDRRRIPGTDEQIPVIGLGTSHEFDHVPADGGKELKAVLTTLVDQGGTLIDTAPRYGDAEEVLGTFFRELALTDTIFISTKVGTRGAEQGLRSMEQSQRLLGKKPLDLMMVHSLVDAETQLKNLRNWKEAGRVRYIGITTSSKSGFAEMESLIRSHDLDFVQVNYSPLEPEAARRVIPAAAERGVAVMINRAFGNGEYFGLLRGRQLPEWAADFDCESWAQFSLKYILGDPHVTCVLAATSNSRHMRDNAAAGSGRLPDRATRRRIEEYLQRL